MGYIILSIDELIFFKMVKSPPTSSHMEYPNFSWWNLPFSIHFPRPKDLAAAIGAWPAENGGKQVELV